MLKIEKRYYTNFYDIFSEVGSYTYLLSSIDGIVNGELYADDAENPTYAIMLTADGYYPVGNLNGEKVKRELFNLSQSDVFLDFTGFMFANKQLNRIKEIFGEHTYKFVERNNYKLYESEIKKFDSIEFNNDIVHITPDNISNFKDYKNYEDFYEECISYWNEYPANSRINFCKVLVKDNSIVSYCYICGESSSENSCELGIETFEEFQRKGYAEIVCREAIKEVIKFNYDHINWHCDVSNIGSNKTALKLGFKMAEGSLLGWFKKNSDKKLI